MNWKRLQSAVYFFILGFLAVWAAAFMLHTKPEVFPQEHFQDFTDRTIIWKLKDFSKLQETVTLRAQHRFAGDPGTFTFVVYELESDTWKNPRVIKRSPAFTSLQINEWSEWKFQALRPNLFVGLTWTQDEPPIYVQTGEWQSVVRLYNYAFTSDAYQENITVPSEMKRKLSLRANFDAAVLRTDFTRSKRYYLLSLTALLATLAAMAISAKRLQFFHVTLLIAGCICAFRLFAALYAPFWAWGSYTIYFLPPLARYLLVALVPVVCFAFAAQAEKIKRLEVRRKNIYFWSFLLSTIVLAIGFYCRRRYGDSIYGYKDEIHAPLLSIFFEIVNNTLSWDFWGLEFSMLRAARVFSVVLLFPYFWILRRILDKDTFDSKWLFFALPFFLSLSTLQDFFGYIEVYAVPTVFYLVYAYYAFRAFEGGSLILPSLIAFLAYLSHVTEGAFVFSLIYVWAHAYFVQKRHVPELARTAAKTLASALGILVLVCLLLYLLKFDGDVERMRRRLPLLGFDFLFGGPPHPPVFLYWFAPFNDPNGTYPIFSSINFLKVANFMLHYSLFCFLLPVFFFCRERVQMLKDPKIVFGLINLVVYLLLMWTLRVGYYPQILDWDMFAPAAIVAALLTYVILVKKQLHLEMELIVIVNLLHTLPWIAINHGYYYLPWGNK